MDNKGSDLDYIKWRHELAREDAKRKHDEYNNFLEKINESTITQGNTTLRTILTINAGACIAILAFIGQIVSQGKILVNQIHILTGSLSYFSYGIWWSCVAIGLAYYTNYFGTMGQSEKIRTWEHPFLESTPKSEIFFRAANLFSIFTVFTALLGIYCFLAGAKDIQNAIHLIRG